MEDVRWTLLSGERFRAAVFLSFAGSAVFLALVGIFGLVAYTVGGRQREIAIRVALGAMQRHVLRVATLQALAPAFVGIVVGLAGAAVATRLLSSFLVDLRPLDLATFATACGVLALAAGAAALLPARQARRIDPVEILRSECRGAAAHEGPSCWPRTLSRS